MRFVRISAHGGRAPCGRTSGERRPHDSQARPPARSRGRPRTRIATRWRKTELMAHPAYRRRYELRLECRGRRLGQIPKWNPGIGEDQFADALRISPNKDLRNRTSKRRSEDRHAAGLFSIQDRT